MKWIWDGIYLKLVVKIKPWIEALDYIQNKEKGSQVMMIKDKRWMIDKWSKQQPEETLAVLSLPLKKNRENLFNPKIKVL